MQINGREIGPGHPPYIVCELSGEHRGRLTLACELIDAAKAAGADAVKAQLVNPTALANARGGVDRVLTEGLWKGRTLLSLYDETYTPREWLPELFAYARKRGITLFSSVFDEEGVDYLETLDCPAYKISSFEVTNLALIRKAAATGKPLIISTGMASQGDILKAMIPARDVPLALLHCVSAYPCSIEDANLRWIKNETDDVEVHSDDWSGDYKQLRQYRRNHDLVIGLSDHTIGTTAAIVATALGASIIEKHITLDRKNGGPDAAFSLEPAEFKKLVDDVKDAYASLGTGERPQSESIYRDLRHKGS